MDANPKISESRKQRRASPGATPPQERRRSRVGQSASRKRAERWPPQHLSEEVLAEIERELGSASPNEKVRSRLALCVHLYLTVFLPAPPPMEAAVRKRLKGIKTAASKLHKLLNEDVAVVAARAAFEAALDKVNGGRIDSGWFIGLLDQLPENNKEHLVLRQVRGVLLRRIGLDRDELSEKLERLYTFINNRKKSSGGNPGFRAWNRLMQDLAAIYADETGEKPTVTENEHRAETNERYSGRFVRIATLVDRATAEIASETYGTAPRSNSALGSALRYLLEPKRRRSKTP
jgi:hypothetical protein